MGKAKSITTKFAEERSAIERQFFEPRLDAIGLSEEKIKTLDAEGLREALDQLNTSIRNPSQFGTLRVAHTANATIVVTDPDKAHVELGILPLLLERKQQALTLLRADTDSTRVASIQGLVEKVPEAELRSSLEHELSVFQNTAAQLEREQLQAAQQMASEEERLTVEIERERFRVERFERRSAVWQKWLERESVATLVGAAFLLIAGIGLVVAMFTNTTTPDILANAFLLVLGYFFGQTSSRRSDP